MVRMSGARACVETLRSLGVSTIFGFPGGAIMPFYDALIDSGIKHILARHEQCAAHMADGFARASGRIGLCSATSGPGATNLVTGVATAFMDSSPIVAITGQVATSLIGTEAFQEANVMSLFASITKHAFQPLHAKEIPNILTSAFQIAMSGRPGPVIVDLPQDVQLAEDDIKIPATQVKLNSYPMPPMEQIKEAVILLVNSKRPLILVGGGGRLSNASRQILSLAQKLGIPVMTTFAGKGCMPENHSLALGTIGMHGKPYANLLATQADVILAVGCRFSDRSTSSKEFGRHTTLIHVDVDSSEIGRAVPTRLPIVGDARFVLDSMLKLIPPTPSDQHEQWLQHVQNIKASFVQRNHQSNTIHPPQLLKLLRDLLPHDAIVTTDVGQHQMWAGLFFDAYDPRCFLSSTGLGTMGFGFPAALGAKVAKPDKLVVNIAGDGSFLMTEQELACSVQHNIPVIVIILRNRMLGMVAQWQRTFYKGRYSAVELGQSPDFVKLAQAYGAHGILASSYAELKKAVKEAMASDVTTIIEVPIPPEEDVYPFVVPGKPLDTPLLGKEFLRKNTYPENNELD